MIVFAQLAVALQEVGEPALAEREARTALSLHIALFGELHVYTGTCANNLATLLQQQGALTVRWGHFSDC